jgi:Undecaprenyl-phosphate glucose phosphotransferase
MNYVNHDPGARKSIALGSLKETARQPRPWAISYRAVAPLAMACDALIIFSMSMISGVAYHLETLGRPGDLEQFGGFAAVVAALFITLGKNRDIYELSELLNYKAQIWKISIIWAVVFLFLTSVAFAMKVGGDFSRGATLSFVASGMLALIAARALWRVYLADGLTVRRFAGRKVILIADQAATVDTDLIESLTRHGLQLAQQFVLPSDHGDVERRREIIAQAIASVRGSNIEEVVVGANLEHWPDLQSLMAELRVLPLPVNLVPVGPMSDLFRLKSHTIGDAITVELQRGPRTLTERFVKRVFDAIVAAVALLLLVPLFVMTAIAIKIDSPGPIIFKQRRRGFNGRQFQILKFRTMRVQEDGETIIQAQRNDSRVTRVGNWLRRTSIDELPQLFNVLQGTMSVVGPRPHAVAHDNHFDKLIIKYAYRHHVNPGLTGWAQVSGFRGELRSVTDIEQRIKHDLWYIDNWSLVLDFKIILMTIIEILRGENAY